MAEALDSLALDTLFTAARTHNSGQDRQVTDDPLLKICERVKMGPTSANCSPALAGETAFRNAPLQAACLIAACRASAPDTGPMSGFDREAVDAAFFADSGWNSNLPIDTGYGDIQKVYARLPQLSFTDACTLE